MRWVWHRLLEKIILLGKENSDSNSGGNSNVITIIYNLG